jgi:hypothetical protein
MDVSVWWVAIGAAVGLCAGIVLFAVLTMASDRDVEAFPDAQAPTQN